MDSGTLIALSIVLGVAFLICSQAKNKDGKKYGIKGMLPIWAVAVGLLGTHALFRAVTTNENHTSKVPLVAVILVLMPFFMIGSKIVSKQKKKADPDSSLQS